MTDHTKSALAVLELTKLVAAKVQAKSASERIRIDAEIERLKLLIEYELRTQDNAQRELVINAVFAAEHQKFDAVFTAYTKMQAMYQEHHTSLVQERDKITDKMLELTNIGIINNYKKRLSAINAELTNLQTRANLLLAEFNSTAATLGSSFKLPQLLIQKVG